MHFEFLNSFARTIGLLAADKGYDITHRSILDSSIPQNSRIIVLADLESDFLAKINSEEFDGLKEIFRKASSLLWVTAGGLIDGSDPKAALMVGLMRAITTEMPLVKFACVDMDSDYDKTSDVTAEMILSKEEELQGDSKSESIDGEYVLKDGVFHVSRLVPDISLNERFLEQEELVSTTDLVPLEMQKPMGIGFDQAGLLSSLYFKEDKDFSLPLNEEWIEIETRAVGLNVKVSTSAPLPDSKLTTIGPCRRNRPL